MILVIESETRLGPIKGERVALGSSCQKRQQHKHFEFLQLIAFLPSSRTLEIQQSPEVVPGGRCQLLGAVPSCDGRSGHQASRKDVTRQKIARWIRSLWSPEAMLQACVGLWVCGALMMSIGFVAHQGLDYGAESGPNCTIKLKGKQCGGSSATCAAILAGECKGDHLSTLLPLG